jgi:hypothetical protein
MVKTALRFDRVVLLFMICLFALFDKGFGLADVVGRFES